MQLSTLLLTIMASLAIAVPTNTGGGGGGGGDGGGGGGGDDGGDNGGGDGGGDGGGSTPYDPCRSTLLNAQPQCCSADVGGGIADLTCATVSKAPSSPDNFREICAETGQTAQCCTVSVIGVSLLCAVPVGV